jgi:FK506-binding protein 1
MGVEVNWTVKNEDAPMPAAGTKVHMHYTGRLTDGTKFDSSLDRGKLFTFTLGVGQVIKGWDEGVLQLHKGDKATLTCSSDYAYGDSGIPGTIPPKATLVFEVELVDF